jgi:toxin ParE1/3/4
MACVTLRPQAQADILDVWNYIAEHSVAEADRWIDRLEDCLTLWATQPHMGRVRDELSPGIRSLAFGRYVVFYEPSADGMDVVRVLHGSRDIDEQFR